MKAIGNVGLGSTSGLQVIELPKPIAASGEACIRVHAAAINPTDTYIAAGRIGQRSQAIGPPFVPGMDVAGTIDHIGPTTLTALSPGEAVIAIVFPSGPSGGYSEYVTVPIESVCRAPKGVSMIAASTIPMNGLTALLTLDLLQLDPGASIAVTGAAGTYGGYVVELSKRAGQFVIADAAPSDVDFVESLGTDVLIPRDDQFASHVRSHIAAGVDALADGAVIGNTAVRAIRDGGGYAAVRRFESPLERGIVLHQVWVDRYLRETSKLAELAGLAECGDLTLRVADVYRPEQAEAAHLRLAAGGTRGRLVIEF